MACYHPIPHPRLHPTWLSVSPTARHSSPTPTFKQRCLVPQFSPSGPDSPCRFYHHDSLPACPSGSLRLQATCGSSARTDSPSGISAPCGLNDACCVSRGPGIPRCVTCGHTDTCCTTCSSGVSCCTTHGFCTSCGHGRSTTL
jgi:hypothetical protein